MGSVKKARTIITAVAVAVAVAAAAAVPERQTDGQADRETSVNM